MQILRWDEHYCSDTAPNPQGQKNPEVQAPVGNLSLENNSI